MKQRRNQLVLLAAVLSLTQHAEAKIKLPRLVGNDMILQQRISNTIWGWNDPGSVVEVKASWGESAKATAGKDGKWSTLLKTPAHGTGHSLTISSGIEKIKINNVAIGEVWLCAGQSNMGWSMGNSFGGEEESTKANAPNFRIFKSSREHWHTPLDVPRDRLSKWKPCTPASAAETSAVSYYFGKKLHAELGVPVGIIVQAYAGTPIEGWMPWAVQKDNARSQQHRDTYDKNSVRQIEKQGLSQEKSVKTFEKQLAEYNAKIDAGETMKNKVRTLSPPIITTPSDLGHQYPAHMYNAMLHPIVPYGIRGAIWYQGERNSKNVPQALAYRKQLALLINTYRTLWHEKSGGQVADDFPFYFTQLPSWNPAQLKPVEGLEAPWVVSREMMRQVTLDLPNTGMVVAIDTGDPVALHPKNKKPLGLRHAYLALKQVYGKKVVASGPRYQGQTVSGNKMILKFDSVGSG